MVSPVGGTYTTAQNVSITCATPNAEIRYTLDGSEPLKSSTLYTGAINISSSATLTAKAFKSGWTDSNMVTQSYTITGKVTTPVISPVGGTYTTAQNVSITCATPDAEIRYTLDETEPSTSSTLYTGAINISSSKTLKAKAFKPTWTDSDTVSQAYTLKVQSPVMDPVGGTYTDAQNVTITCATSGAEIRYTLDGSEPSKSSTLYTGAINISSSKILKAKAFKPTWTDSDTVSQTYTLKVQSPVMNPAGGTYTDVQNVTITCETSDAEIRYTLDGSEPSKSSILYTGTINISDPTTIKAKAFKPGWTDSDTVSHVYKFILKMRLSKCFGGTDYDYLCNVIQTNDGKYLAVGYTNSKNGDVSSNHGKRDGWLIKVDSNGNTIWSKAFGGTGNDYLCNVRQTDDNGYVAVGYTTSNDGDISGNHGNGDGWIVKVDSNGNTIWSKAFGGFGAEKLNSVYQTSDGGYIAVGYTLSNDGWVIKVDSSGNLLWSKAFGGSSSDILYNVIQTDDGGYIAVGNTYSNNGDISGNHGGYEGWIIKVDSSGNLLWSKVFGGTSAEQLNSIYQSDDGGYIAVGYAYSNDGDISGNHGNGDGWILKVDETGNKEWSEVFGGTNYDSFDSIIKTSNGEYITVGYTESNDGDVSGNHGNGDGWIVKFK
jgi:Tfp pilus assembly protein PilV